jgi:D-alanine--poly(phosphoribitol) ligase subunit 1
MHNGFLERIRGNCDILPENTAYICDGEKLTYGELWRKACALAAFLYKGGGCPVLVYGHKSAEMPIAFLACLLSGRAYVPCDSETPPSRMRQMKESSGASLTILTEDIEAAEGRTLTKAELRKIYGNSEHCALPQKNDRTAYIIFTSGSTGVPKGVPISIGNLQNFIDWVTTLPAIADLSSSGKSPHGTVLNQAAFSFDLSVADLYIALVTGRTLFALTRKEQQNPALLFSRMKESNCILAVLTPTFAQGCLCDTAFNRALMPTLQTVLFCGEPLPATTVKKLFSRFDDLRMLNAYGPTEATCAVCAVQISQEMLARPALPVAQITTDQKPAVTIMLENGEIVLRGASVSRGYLTPGSSAFREGGFYTGDIGKIDGDYLYCLGRKDDQIKYKGYRIELGEIEYALCCIDGINGAAVLPLENGCGRIVRLCAAVETSERTLCPATVKASLRETLPDYMIPKTIAFFEWLPVNGNGKCDRNKLKDGFMNGQYS